MIGSRFIPQKNVKKSTLVKIEPNHFEDGATSLCFLFCNFWIMLLLSFFIHCVKSVQIRSYFWSVFGYFLCSVRKYKQINFFPHKMITKPMVFWWFQGTEVSWLIRSNLFNICSGIWERSLTWRLIWNDTKVLIIQKNQNVSGSSSCKSWRRAKMLPKVGQVIPG